ncbi:Uncharacterised protein [uncultured archaeon]|nr:Uncharacterised protein [uncultured archaeon]
MKGIVFGLILVLVLLFVFGCTDQSIIPNAGDLNISPNNSGSNVSGGDSTSSEITFLPPAVLPEATEGTDYLYNFCNPQPTGNSVCGSYGQAGVTTEPVGGNWVYLFSILSSESLPPNFYITNNGKLVGSPRDSGTYSFSVCVKNDQSVVDNSVCKTTSLTVKPYIHKVDYNVAITIDSAIFRQCVPGDIHSSSGGWEVVAQGTMTSNIPFWQGPERSTPGYRAPTVGFYIISTTASFPEDMISDVYAEDMDCGTWKLIKPVGYSAYCEKEAGDPDTAIWKVTHSQRTIESERVGIGASIKSYNPDNYADYVPADTNLNLYSRIEKSVGTC